MMKNIPIYRQKLKHLAIERRKKKRRGYKRNCVKLDLGKATNVKVVLPKIFSLENNPNGVIHSVREALYKEPLSNLEKKSVFFDLSEIDSIDIGALSMLFGVVNWLSKKGVSSRGNFPENIAVKKFIQDAGFIEHFKVLNAGPEDYICKGSLSLLRGEDEAKIKKISDVIDYALNNIGDIEELKKRKKKVYTLLSEMCINAVEHANINPINKNWILSMLPLSNTLVSLVFLDIGEGVLGTIKKKKRQKVSDLLQRKSALDVLLGVFEGKYQSSTLEENRNKGLPKILEICMSNTYITTSFVVTNDAFLSLTQNREKDQVLNNSFKGTIYYLEIELL